MSIVYDMRYERLDQLGFSWYVSLKKSDLSQVFFKRWKEFKIASSEIEIDVKMAALINSNHNFDLSNCQHVNIERKLI